MFTAYSHAFRWVRMAVCVLAALAFGTSVAGAAETAADALAKLKGVSTKTTLSADDQKAIAGFVEGVLDKLADDLQKPIDTTFTAAKKHDAISKTRDVIVKGLEGSAEFKRAVAKELGRLVAERIGRQSAAVSLNDLSLMVELNDVVLADAYVQALGAKESAIAVMAMQGVTGIRDKMDAAQMTAVVAAVEPLMKSSDDVVVDAAVRLLDQPKNAACRKILVAAAKERQAVYGQSPLVLAASDMSLVRACGSLYGSANDAEKSTVVAALADMLKGVTLAELATPVEPSTLRRRSAQEKTLSTIERALSDITDKSKNLPVSKALGTRDLDGAFTALAGWVGGPSTKGTLNEAPFNVPVLLKDAKRPAVEVVKTGTVEAAPQADKK